MPFPVKYLIEGHSNPTTVYREDTVIKALNQMVTYDYSQLPVIDPDSRPLGMVTYEEILRGVRNFKTQLEELHVRDVMRNAPVFHLEDDLFELLEQLKQNNAVLIADPGGMLAGIVTSYDSTEYFRNRAENLMRVEDIEVMIKDLILLAYTQADGSVDEARLANAIVAVTPKEDVSSKEPKSFDELTLGQYVSLLTSKNTWSFFEAIFKVPRSALIKLLDDVRNTRNDLAHFRGDISAEQTDQLRFCADWLARCWDECQQLNNQKILKDLFVSQTSLSDQPMMIREETGQYPIIPNAPPEGESTEAGEGEIQIVAEEARFRESRYAPLIDYLQSQPGSIEVVKLTFEEVEKIIAGELPASARSHRVWWANDAVGHPQSQLWLEAGWRTSYVNMSNQHVTFNRIREREKAYIEFFNKLVIELQARAKFPIRPISPDGVSWVTCQTVASPVSLTANYSYSFARGKRFRVELYIDTGEQKTTKEIFDRILAHRVNIEEVLDNVSWERIDDKRASRIALYHPGAITDDEEQLSALRAWAVPMMINFYNTVEPIASQVVKEVLKS